MQGRNEKTHKLTVNIPEKDYEYLCRIVGARLKGAYIARLIDNDRKAKANGESGVAVPKLKENSIRKAEKRRRIVAEKNQSELKSDVGNDIPLVDSKSERELESRYSHSESKIHLHEENNSCKEEAAGEKRELHDDQSLQISNGTDYAHDENENTMDIPLGLTHNIQKSIQSDDSNNEDSEIADNPFIGMADFFE